MNLYSKQINSAFLISLLFTFLTPALFHSLRILFFSPFLVILFTKKNYRFVCGVLAYVE
ncbi:hypothetical protein pah_c004o181 [Parachlamydia acanthamoebae str. Hall's coccus]|nr:hypothetical protein pah_c004o181 [Parachlamydia acanthamoebae str. Hall's coccus]